MLDAAFVWGNQQPPQLAEKLNNVVPDELKQTEVEERRKALRIALVRRMKQDLLDGATAEEPDAPGGGLRVNQVRATTDFS